MEKLFIGLGNPGDDFENTYHNTGRIALEAFIEGIGGAPAAKPATHKDLFMFVRFGKGVAVFPLTFMNESGIAVREAMKKFKASPADLVVFHDESDLSVGSWKISEGRGAAGHRGAQSIMDAIGTKEFTRVRIGIRDPKERTRKKASLFVLKAISKKDRKAIEEAAAAIAEKL